MKTLRIGIAVSLMFVLLTTGCSRKGSVGKKPGKKVDVEWVHPIRQQVYSHLTSKGEGAYDSYIQDTVNGMICKLIFPASSWELARKEGYMFLDIIARSGDQVFDVLYRMMLELKCREIEISSLWRPLTPGNPNSPHHEGRAIDITRMKSKYGETKFTVLASGSETAYVKLIRTWCFPNNPDIVQYFSPWMMCNEKASCSQSCCVNDKVSSNHKIHQNHMHITLSKVPEIKR